MHFEILVEDQSSKKALDILVPKLSAMTIRSKSLRIKVLVVYPKTCALVSMQASAFFLIIYHDF